MTQMRAVYLLGEKRVVEAVGSLAQLFRRNKNPFLQTEIIEAIGKIGGDSAYSIVIEALRHPSFIVRGEAAKALGSFPGHDSVKQALARALKDPSSYVRERSQEALERLEGISTSMRE
jgi:HEAT repeat protein